MTAGQPPPVALDLEAAPLLAVAAALGQHHRGGPFECPNKWCRARAATWLSSRACFIQRPGLARCFACGDEFTVWRLRRLVLEDPVLVRRLARILTTEAA